MNRIHTGIDNGWVILLASSQTKKGLGSSLRAIQSQPLAWVPDGGEVLAYLLGEDKYTNRVTYPFPNLLCLDCRLPVLSGLSVLCWLRNEPRFEHLPVILFGDRFLDPQIATAAGLQAACCSKLASPAQLQEAILRSVRLALEVDLPDTAQAPVVWDYPDPFSRSIPPSACSPSARRHWHGRPQTEAVLTECR